jgi:CTP-dependent riboflavin kinase
LFSGRVLSGSGSASHVPGDVFRARCAAAQVQLIRGTLNLCVDDIRAALRLLGPPDFATDIDTPHLGPLRWWRIMLILEGTARPVPAFIVRHDGTGTTYLEVMATVRFRELGVMDGDIVVVERLP